MTEREIGERRARYWTTPELPDFLAYAYMRKISADEWDRQHATGTTGATGK